MRRPGTTAHAPAGALDPTPERVWRDLPAWEAAPDLTLTTAGGRAAEHLLVVVAHPDDETLAVGGLIHEAGRRGLRTTVLVASDGEASHPDSPTHTSAQLAGIRRAELTEALGILNPTAEHRCLGLEDGRLGYLTGRLEAEITTLADPGTVLVSTWRHDGHPDHEAVGRAAAGAAGVAGCRHLEAPIWAWSWTGPEDLPWHQVRLLRCPPAAVRRKEEALAAYTSQTGPLSDHPADAAVLDEGVLEHFRRPFEALLDASASPAAEPIAPVVFDRMYAVGDDPWRHERSWYETRKRAATLAALPTDRLGRVLEIGPATGLLTLELAGRADSVVSIDVSAEALRRARRRIADAGLAKRVEMLHGRVPDTWPAGRFDTVVVSEVAYYLTPGEWSTTLRLVDRCLSETGTLVLVHWAHRLRDCPLDAETAHDLAVDVTALRTTVHHVEEDFLLRVLRRRGLPSVAVAERRV
jgi:LmbE family N-acetylglucosaminyl deacetylase